MIPLKIETLLADKVVESDRVEYKRGWNPAEVITTICAFANDFNNTNGGYIVIGIEEKYGRPSLPPVGIDPDYLDKVQQELFQYCNFISPRYTPQTEIIQYQDKHLLYLWCSAGDDGPYSAPEDVLSKNKHKEYWIKPSSVKAIAKGAELSELFSKFNSVPFDDRVNRQAKMEDIRRGHLEDFLVDSNSALKTEINKKPIEDILIALEVANATDVGVDIRNIGLLMFGDRPEKFLPGAQIELIRFNSPDAEGSDDFTEKVFTGPIQKQVRDALSYINTILIEEKVVKRPDRAEADRFFNYPYSALEEILVNSVLHKSYRVHEPVEIRIYVDCIKVINYPGPEKLINMKALKAGKAISRHYRNRRIGDFLKEIDMSEKKSTGITKILRTLDANGSPPPEFETNEDRDYLIVTIHPHPDFETKGQANGTVNGTDGTVNGTVNGTDGTVNGGDGGVNGGEILKFLSAVPSATYDDLAEQLSVPRRSIAREMKLLCDQGKIRRIGSDKSGYWEINEHCYTANDGVNGTDDGVNGTANGTVNGTDGTVNGTVNRSEVLKLLSDMPNATYDELAEQLSIPRRSIAREIRALREQGTIKRIGSDKSGYWEITGR